MKCPYPSTIIFFTIAITLVIVSGSGKIARADTFTALSKTNYQKTDTVRLTLARAKQIALENNPTLISAMERINQAREAVNQTKADYLPTITTQTGMDYNEKTENSSTEYDENSYTHQVSVTQVLFNGFYRKYSKLSAEYKEEMSLAARDDAKRLLSWSVAQAFLNTQLAVENIKIARADMAFNKEQEIEAAAKEKAGSGSYSDVLNFKTKVNSGKSALLSAQQDYKETYHGLAALLGFENASLPEGMIVSELELDTQGQGLAGEIDPESDPAIDALVFSRPDIIEAFLSVRDAHANIGMVKSSYFPTISLTGAYGTASDDTFFDRDSMGASLGINVSFDIFSGGAKKSKVRQALAEKREKESVLADAKTTAVSNIKIAAKKITTARQQLALQVENTLLIKITRDLVQKEFNAGQASLVRLNEAQNDLVTAQGNLSLAKVSLILALEEFDYYIGKNINPV